MDKNYNVDDILSEIKSRKSREKSGATPPAGSGRPPRAHPEPRFRPSDDMEAETYFAPAAPTSPQEPEFHFDFDPEPQARPKSNPMDFSGHVRPITDKARMRPGKLNQPRPPAQSFDFLPPEEGMPAPEQPQARPPVDFAPPGQPPRAARPPVDFSAFRPSQDAADFDEPPLQDSPTGYVPDTGFGSARAALPDDVEQAHGHTRVLPSFRDQVPDDEASLGGSRLDFGDGYYENVDEMMDDLPEGSAIDFSEYNSVEDRRDVATDIARVKLWLFVRTALTVILTFILFWLSLSGRFVELPLPPAIFPEADTMRAYLLACTVLTALVALVNSSSVGGGLLSLFKMRANSDTLATLAVLAAIGQGVAGVVRPENVDPAALNLYYPIASLAMLFNAFGKFSMINRIQTNFRVLSTDKKKRALMRVEDGSFCHEFYPDELHRPTIVYSVQADFFTDFLGLSYSDKYDVGINRAVAPVCLVSSIVVAVATYMLTASSLSALSALTAILCVSATLSSTFVENVPLSKLAKRLAPQGGMVSGNKAVEDFCDTAALVLTETDLFPKGHVRLRGIKTFSQNRIDEAILDAASVVCSTGGALSPVFMQMIGENRKLLKKVDNVVYENGMGVSAWVNSRRVLIGNRFLMQNHGISLPPEAVAAAQSRAPEDGELLYLANSGEVAAQFAVSYHIDEDLAGELDMLAVREKLLIIYTTDCNITPHRIWEMYGYPEELIEIMPAERHVQFKEMTAPRENAVAEIVYTSRASAMAGAVTACINARSSILYATIVQLVQIVLGYGLIAFMSFMGVIGALTILQMCVYQFFWFLVIFIVQKLKTS